MEDKKAIDILLGLSEKYPLNKEEKEAVSITVGILNWSTLAKSRIKSLKEKQKMDAEWK